jgi:hypothetical protein
VRWFGTNTDVTEQREIEAELRRLNQRSGQPASGGATGRGAAVQERLPRHRNNAELYIRPKEQQVVMPYFLIRPHPGH